jgi:hypothetical protein
VRSISEVRNTNCVSTPFIRFHGLARSYRRTLRIVPPHIVTDILCGCESLQKICSFGVSMGIERSSGDNGFGSPALGYVTRTLYEIKNQTLICYKIAGYRFNVDVSFK